MPQPQLVSNTGRTTWWTAFLLAIIALAFRLCLMPYYYGWEESDYGNLAMARGVLESGFRDYDMRHLPLYYFLSAAVLSVVDDTILATHIVSLVSGTAAVIFGYLLAREAFGQRAGVLAGVLLCIQPELALYSASSLREPLFTALVLAGGLALIRRRDLLSATATGLSFLTRFDSLATNMVVTFAVLLRRKGGRTSPRVAILGPLAVFTLFVAGWSAYCKVVHGTFLFFLPTVEVNIETGGAQEITERLPFILHGLKVAAALFFVTLPRHLSVVVWLLAFGAMVRYRRDLGRVSARGTLFLYLVFNTAFWLAIGFVGQHEPGHNLYWKWLYVVIPFWLIFAAGAAVAVVDRLRNHRLWAVATAVAMAAAVGWSFAAETARQLNMSARLYRPQVELAEWVEAHVPPGTSLIFDNIPACYIDRRPHEWHFLSWFDLDIPPGDRGALARLIAREDVRYVLWFKEDWTEAPVIAPYLAEPVPHTIGRYRLEPLFHEEEYGFIFYAVKPRPTEAQEP